MVIFPSNRLIPFFIFIILSLLSIYYCLCCLCPFLLISEEVSRLSNLAKPPEAIPVKSESSLDASPLLRTTGKNLARIMDDTPWRNRGHGRATGQPSRDNAGLELRRTYSVRRKVRDPSPAP
jgi:hypothetical protein